MTPILLRALFRSFADSTLRILLTQSTEPLLLHATAHEGPRPGEPLGEQAARAYQFQAPIASTSRPPCCGSSLAPPSEPRSRPEPPGESSPLWRIMRPTLARGFAHRGQPGG